MEEKRRLRYTVCFVSLLIGMCILLVANVMVGSARLSIPQVLRILFTRMGDNAAIIWKVRMPRLLAAAILGGALSVSGFLLQTFFANPIAGPFVLGISSSAKLVVALTMIWTLSQGIVIGSVVLIAAAFVGAMLSMGAVLLVSNRLHSMALLIVCGVMIGYICSAVTDIVVTFASDSNIVNLHNWSLGSFSGKDWGDVTVIAIVVFLALAGAFLLLEPMGA